ncbi:MAG: hypothetical protein F6K58_09485 [Symploca sp. SIO2E9]|nr:hypothetical protein [Symploca sp. SIO2E9]
MKSGAALSGKKKGFIKSSTLVLLAFATMFFSRCFDTLGAPSTINFLHFATVPFACGVTLLKSRSKDRHQIAISWALITGLFILFWAIFASALWNQAGVINAVLSFMLLGEPFVMLLAIISLPMSPASLEKFKTWMRRFFFFHLFLALFQRHVLRMNTWNTPGLASPDHIQGVFWRSGAGHVVGASVSLSFGVYYLVSAKTVPIWIRAAVALATFWQMLIADAKQVLLAFLVGGVLLILTKVKDITKLIKYVIGAIVLVYVLLWCLQNVEAFAAFNVWMRPHIYGPEGEATLLKTATFRIVPSYYESFMNWLLGLGPGHTVGRLGGWMIKEYADLLEPLGSTRHPASRDVWQAVAASYLGASSSMFSPLFGWAGIWGDLGFLGLAAYLFLSFLVWRYLCLDDFSRFLMFSVFAIGLVFSQMEEPGYMLSVAAMIGLQWHEHQGTSRK